MALAFLTLGHIPSFSIPGVGHVQGYGQVAHASELGFVECLKNPTSTTWWRGGVCRLASVALGALSAFKTFQSIITKMVVKQTRKGKEFKALPKSWTLTIPNIIAGIKIWENPISFTFHFSEAVLTVLCAIVFFSVVEIAFRACMCFDKIGFIDNSDPNEKYA